MRTKARDLQAVFEWRRSANCIFPFDVSRETKCIPKANFYIVIIFGNTKMFHVKLFYFSLYLRRKFWYNDFVGNIFSARRCKMAKIITVFNQKGGVGKTTTAVNLAAGVGEKGKKVLLVDIDQQGNTTSGFGINKKELRVSSYDVLIGNCSAKDAIIHTKFKNIDVLPSNRQVAGAEVELIGLEHRESQLKKALITVCDDYDYIFIDCPPSIGLVSINGLCASDTFLVPLQCEYLAMEGLSQLMASVREVKRLYNPSLELEGILLTMFDGRLNLTQQVVAEVKKYFAKKLYSTVIPRSVRISEAPSYGMPIQYYDPKGKGADAYNALAKEFLKKNRG